MGPGCPALPPTTHPTLRLLFLGWTLGLLACPCLFDFGTVNIHITAFCHTPERIDMSLLSAVDCGQTHWISRHCHRIDSRNLQLLTVEDRVQDVKAVICHRGINLTHQSMIVLFMSPHLKVL